MSKKSKPISSFVKNRLKHEFLNSQIHFPPVMGYVKGHTTRIIDLNSIIEDVSKTLEKKESDKLELKHNISKNSKKTSKSLSNFTVNDTDSYLDSSDESSSIHDNMFSYELKRLTSKLNI
jgi:hypothetical protein